MEARIINNQSQILDKSYSAVLPVPEVCIEQVKEFQFGPKDTSLRYSANLLIDQGSAEVRGDVARVDKHNIAIGDATNSVYSGDIPLDYKDRQGNKISGEQWLSNLYLELACELREMDPREQAIRLNGAVGLHLRTKGYNLEHSHSTPGIVGAIAYWSRKHLKIAYWGDVVAIVETKSGKFHCSKNQVYKHDSENMQTIARIKQEIREGKTDKSLWELFKPILIKRRCQRSNKKSHKCGYGILNGQDGFKDFIRTFTVPTNDVKKIFLSTDGFVNFEDTKNLKQKAPEFMKSLSDAQSLVDALNKIRQAQAKNAYQTHIKFPEALGLLIDVH